MHDLFVPARRWLTTGCLTLFAVGTVGCEYSPTDKDIVVMPLNRVQELYEKSRSRDREAALLIDPRAQQDYELGHISGARNLLLRQVNPKRDRDPELEAFDVLIVYGDNPGSAPARAMVKRLLVLGYDDVKWYPGGLEEWREAGLPIDPPEARTKPVTTEPAAETKPGDASKSSEAEAPKK